MNIAFNQNTPK